MVVGGRRQLTTGESRLLDELARTAADLRVRGWNAYTRTDKQDRDVRLTLVVVGRLEDVPEAKD